MFDLDLDLTRWINIGLIKEPLNWAIVFVFASFALLFFHVVMTAFNAMQGGGQQQAFAGPGQVNIPNATANFASPGVLGGSSAPNGLQQFYGRPPPSWADGVEARYAEDGWTGLT
jgi:hypothetical protein